MIISFLTSIFGLLLLFNFFEFNSFKRHFVLSEFFLNKVFKAFLNISLDLNTLSIFIIDGNSATAGPALSPHREPNHCNTCCASAVPLSHAPSTLPPLSQSPHMPTPRSGSQAQPVSSGGSVSA